MIAVVHPSYWQRTTFGLVVLLATLPIAASLLTWLVRSVLIPRAAGRRWPEGARLVRPLVEVVVDAQRRAVGDDDLRATTVQSLRFALVVAACAVIPVSTGLVIAQPGLGLYVLPVVLAFEAFTVWESPVAGADRTVVVVTRIGLAALVGLCAGVVVAQWGTARVSGVVTAQAAGSLFGVAGWGLPTLWVQPLAAAVAVGALHLVGVSVASTSATGRGGSIGMVAAVVDQALLIVSAAWLVAAFAGGGSVPWDIANDGVRQVVAVVVFTLKLAVVASALAWARCTWPTCSVRTLRRFLVIGAVIAVVSIGATLLIRAAR